MPQTHAANYCPRIQLKPELSKFEAVSEFLCVLSKASLLWMLEVRNAVAVKADAWTTAVPVRHAMLGEDGNRRGTS